MQNAETFITLYISYLRWSSFLACISLSRFAFSSLIVWFSDRIVSLHFSSSSLTALNFASSCWYLVLSVFSCFSRSLFSRKTVWCKPSRFVYLSLRIFSSWLSLPAKQTATENKIKWVSLLNNDFVQHRGEKDIQILLCSVLTLSTLF